MTAPVVVDAQFPAKLQFLFEPARYKVAYGGRGGTKSWGYADALLIQGARDPLRILCARETQKSIADSVHRLLVDQIARLNLGYYYSVQKASIRGPGGTEFVFAGLKHNVSNIKSLESFDRVWVEEANAVSNDSWEVLIPTIRKNGSEIWISFNPELETDATYQRFVLHPPPNAIVRKVGWEDNPWFPDVLKAEMEHLQAVDPDAFDHVYGGNPRRSVSGAVYAAELRAADNGGRITRVPYDATRPVDTFWDLGWADMTSIWFAQAFPFEYRLIDFLQSSHKPLQWYQKELQSRPYVYGTHYLPHDARAKTLATGRSIQELMTGAGFPNRIVPMLSINDGINAARTIFPQCWFDSEKCADGLQALRHYRYGEIATLATPTREPLHDDASHAADAFREFAVTIKAPKKEAPKRQERRVPVSVWS